MSRHYTQPHPYGHGYCPCDLFYRKPMILEHDASWIKVALICAITATYTLANAVYVYVCNCYNTEQITCRSQCVHSPIHFLHQAVSSFLHFSQIRSWMVASEGSLPFQLLFRYACLQGRINDTHKHTIGSHPFCQYTYYTDL